MDVEHKLFPFYDSLFDIRFDINVGDIWFPEWFDNEWAEYHNIEQAIYVPVREQTIVILKDI